jgi:hypothetical protein
MIEVEIPKVLPVKSLSYSSLKTLMMCPQKWKRTYIDAEYEFRGGAAVLGSAVGGAIGINFDQKVFTHEDLSAEDVLDAYAMSWDKEVADDRQEVKWGEDKPGAIKDKGVLVLGEYHASVAPSVQPVMTERKLTMRYPDVEWVFTGKIDVEALAVERGPFDDETVAPRIIDTKVKAKMFSEAEMATDLQPESYLVLREAEGIPAETFEWHVMQSLRDGPRVTIAQANRSQAKIDTFHRRLISAAREIAWRAENDEWSGALPGTWWCGPKFCGAWNSCPFGGG